MFELSNPAEIAAAADTLVQEMPEPQAHAIEESIRTGATDAPEVSGELDALGIPWNSNDHAISADGTHPKTQKGIWKKRKRKGGSQSTLRTPGGGAAPSEAGTSAPVGPSPQEIAARQTGATLAGMMIATCIGFGGEEWKPGNSPTKMTAEDETAMLVKSFEDYCVAKNVADLPPGVALCFGISMYALPRFTMPVTRSRTQRALSWFKEKIFAWKNRRKGKKAPVVRIVETENETADTN